MPQRNYLKGQYFFSAFRVIFFLDYSGNIGAKLQARRPIMGHVKNNEAPPNSTYQGNLFGSGVFCT